MLQMRKLRHRKAQRSRRDAVKTSTGPVLSVSLCANFHLEGEPDLACPRIVSLPERGAS